MIYSLAHNQQITTLGLELWSLDLCFDASFSAANYLESSMTMSFLYLSA